MADLVITEPSDDKPPSGDMFCEVCGVALEYSGRGRKPKRCLEHRANKNSSSGGGTKVKNVDAMVEAIEEFYLTISTVVGFVPGGQQDMMEIAGNSHKLAMSWEGLLKNDPKVYKMWQRILGGSGWGAVMMSHAMVAYPILMNHGLVPGPKKVPNG